MSRWSSTQSCGIDLSQWKLYRITKHSFRIVLLSFLMLFVANGCHEEIDRGLKNSVTNPASAETPHETPKAASHAEPKQDVFKPLSIEMIASIAVPPPVDNTGSIPDDVNHSEKAFDVKATDLRWFRYNSSDTDLEVAISLTGPMKENLQKLLDTPPAFHESDLILKAAPLGSFGADTSQLDLHYGCLVFRKSKTRSLFWSGDYVNRLSEATLSGTSSKESVIRALEDPLVAKELIP
ncbi:MAG: hypothetical protein C0478_05265 [Planctomyces sp.]|nr:hypothetical protein [Planctomyces sp.]